MREIGLFDPDILHFGSGVACVAGVKRGRGRGNFNAGHAG